MYSICILIYVSMNEYSYPSINSISGLAASDAWEQFKVHLRIIIESTQRDTLRLWTSEFGDSLEGEVQADFAMHSETVI